MAHPRTIQEIVENFTRRKDGLRKALTEGAQPLQHSDDTGMRVVSASVVAAPLNESVLQRWTHSIRSAIRRRTTCACTVRASDALHRDG